MKIGKRLKHIASMVTTDYDHIWDCCCDHGLAGATLLARQTAACIHFVDIVPELMQQLEDKLARFYPPKSHIAQWQVHCMDVAALPLHPMNAKHLVIIAGIGGDLMTELVKAIYQNHPTTDIDFLLCPVHHQFTLRAELIALDFGLKSEALVRENHRYYEILLVSTRKGANSTGSRISPVGSLIWQGNTPEQLTIAADYLTKTLDHYKRMQLNRAANVQHIIDAYSAINL